MEKGLLTAFSAAILFVLLAGCVGGLSTGVKPLNGGSLMKIESTDFKTGAAIPAEFTCDGQNLNPELHWEGAPAETKSFALTVRDPDAPSGTFDHWLVCNIPAGVSSIAKEAGAPAGSKQVPNDFGKQDYGGPCPPSGTHRYFFRLYALSVESIDCSNKDELFVALSKNKIAEAELMGTFAR